MIARPSGGTRWTNVTNCSSKPRQLVVAREVIVLDVGHDRDRRLQVQERTVALVAFGDEPRTGCRPRRSIRCRRAGRRSRTSVRAPPLRGSSRSSRSSSSCRASRRSRSSLREPVSSASIAPRVLMSMPRSSAATNSGLSCAIALDTTTTSGQCRRFRRGDRSPPSRLRVRARRRVAMRCTSEPLTRAPRASSSRAIALMPMPPMPTRWYDAVRVVHVRTRSLRPIRRPVRA